MQSNSNQAIAEDLGFLRGLAQAGQDAPLTAGPYLIAAGGWFGAASLLAWLLTAGYLAWPASAMVWLWVGAFAVFAVFLVARIRRDRGRVEMASNRAVNSAWSAVGVSVFVFWAALSLLAMRRGDWSVMAAMPVFVQIVYGSAWWIAAALTGKRWTGAVAATCYLAALPISWLADRPEMFLAYAMALVATALLPGWALVRGARAIRQ